MADSEQKIQALTEQYQKLQQELQNHIQSQQRLESQQQENKGVQKEFSTLTDDSNVYKLIGPVLLKQDKGEAVRTVNRRLEFIGNEIKRIEGLINDVQEKSDGLRTQLMQLQSQSEGKQQGGGQQQIAA